MTEALYKMSSLPTMHKENDNCYIVWIILHHLHNLLSNKLTSCHLPLLQLCCLALHLETSSCSVPSSMAPPNVDAHLQWHYELLWPHLNLICGYIWCVLPTSTVGTHWVLCFWIFFPFCWRLFFSLPHPSLCEDIQCSKIPHAFALAPISSTTKIVSIKMVALICPAPYKKAFS